jgi:O-Glycosyl hydrolase
MGDQSSIAQKTDLQEGYTLARIIRTARDAREYISEVATIRLEQKKTANGPAVQIDPNEQYQTVLGFGGAFTEASAYVLGKITPEKRQEIINAYFSPITGLNYTMGRVHMNSCDFSLGNYSCDDVDDDIELRNFNISRDRRYVIPVIKEAAKTAGAPIRLLVTPWSPPGWMKTNGTMNYGGSLKEECRETWARFYTSFISAYEQEGIPVWAVSIQNEPQVAQRWDSCLYTAEEEGQFVRDFLGPQFHKDGYDQIKIIIWDHNRDLLYERAKAILSDPETAKYVGGIGFHWYSGDQFDNVGRTYRQYPDKPLIFTEGSIENGVKLGSWDRGEIYAHNMIGDFNHGTAGWIDWNLVLDRTGGPNHAGNYCDALIIADTETSEVFYQSSYYYVGHFSKFVQPGAKRIGCHFKDMPLEIAAFLNPDQRIVIIVLNQGDEDRQFILEIGMNARGFYSPKHSIQTVILE